MTTWRPLRRLTSCLALLTALTAVAGLAGASPRLASASAPSSAPASPMAPPPGTDASRRFLPAGSSPTRWPTSRTVAS
ncbi:MAG: hypothetical protein M3Y71_16060, partial [Actinomycetota bacterium]|nr:hypothetical protein [Actinomycetota bacterium]